MTVHEIRPAPFSYQAVKPAPQAGSPGAETPAVQRKAISSEEHRQAGIPALNTKGVSSRDVLTADEQDFLERLFPGGVQSQLPGEAYTSAGRKTGTGAGTIIDRRG